jgi:hypothetical protein
VAGTDRDCLHAIDLFFSPGAGNLPEVLVTDTGSYSDLIFGIASLLGVDYRPALADLPDQKGWRAGNSATMTRKISTRTTPDSDPPGRGSPRGRAPGGPLARVSRRARVRAVEPVAELPPLRRVDVQRLQLIGREPRRRRTPRR